MPPFLSSLSILLLSEICTENVFHYLDNNLTAAINDAAAADDLFSVLMGEDVEQRRAFIQRNAKDVRFLDI